MEETGEAARSLGRDVFAQTVDVSDPADMDEFAAAVHQRCGAVDVLINNAGIGVLATVPRHQTRRLGPATRGST